MGFKVLERGKLSIKLGLGSFTGIYWVLLGLGSFEVRFK